MGDIEWTDDNSVGIDEIDEQHKELVAITNKLFHAILDGKGVDVLLEVLRSLEAYAKYHFEFEEQLLINHDYPAVELKDHLDEHCALTRQVSEFVAKVEQGEIALDIEVYNFLRNWTDTHMNHTDMAYKAFFQR